LSASARWARVSSILSQALDLPEGRRGAFLADAVAREPALRTEILALFEEASRTQGFLEAPAGLSEAAAFLQSQGGAPRLEAGAELGPYRIQGLIGSGGMGEVYRARDTRLERDVAIKVVPLHVARDSSLKQRFDREAKALAMLSHPHICPVFDVGQHEGVDYLVMEYLEGETLANRLVRGPLPLAEALRRAMEIAGALDGAHRQGIVHRDLKPGNVMLTKGGAKLLDFGIARLLSTSPPAADEAGRAPLTGQGIVLGTLPYMAPEQLRGAEADARTDIFAFGAVLHEMVTGRRPFEGATGLPPALNHLVRNCLAEDPEERWQSASDVRRTLAWLLGEATAPAGPPSPAARPSARRAGLAWLAAAAMAVLAAFFGSRWLARDRVPPPLLQSTLTAPPGALLLPHAGFALSPDGDRLAFVARGTDGVSRLWVRALAAHQAELLAGTEGADSPFWSPDGRDLAFFADQRLKRIPAAGGAVQVLAGEVIEDKGGTWSPDGRIVYVPHYRTGLFEIAASGGTPRALTALDVAAGELSHRWPSFLPDGRTLLFLVQTAEAGARDDRSRIEALDARGTRHELVKVNASAAHAPPGLLLFRRTGAIYAQPFDAERLRLHGEAKLVATGVDLNWSEWATFSVSRGGTLVYAPPLPWRIEWRERSGRARVVPAPETEYSNPALSPDGSRLAYVAGNTAIRVLDLVRGADNRLTPEGADHDAPAWSPDGEWVAYFANTPSGAGGDICRRRSSALGEPEVLHSSPAVVRNLSWSSDGRWIAFEAGEDIHLLDLQSRQTSTRIATGAFEAEPNLSPDGRWLAYTSDESGKLEVYVVPAFDAPGKWQVSSGGGYTPRWTADGTTLFFHGPDHTLKSVTVGPGRPPKFGLAEPVFALPGGDPWRPVYDVGPDGRILVTVQGSPGESESFKLVLNWPRLLDKPSP
jgi:Tol biopolymer transport system component/predicted Ser/Thr protein kinase